MGNLGLRAVGGNPAAPPYTRGPYTWDQFLQCTAGLAGTIIGTAGHIFYIDEENGNDSNDGKSPATAFATFEKCFGNTTGNKMARDDYSDDAEYHIFVAPGTYAPTLDLRLYGHGIHIHGLGVPGTDSGVNITDTGTPTYGCMLVAAANFTIENIQFNMTTDVPAIYMIAADNGIIRNCVFNSISDACSKAIHSLNTRSTQIYNNAFGVAGGCFTANFYNAGTADTYLIDSFISGNRIYSDRASSTGVLIDNGCVSYGTVIANNFINLSGATSLGIDNNAVGSKILIADNYVVVASGCTPIESASSPTGMVGNHSNAGNTIVDPNPVAS